MIEFRNARFSSESGMLLRVHHLLVRQGSNLGIIGRVGSGKTSLLMSLIGFGSLHSGEVLFQGQDIFQHRTLARNQIAFVPSNNGLVANLDVYDNLALVPRYFGKTEKTIEAAVELIVRELKIKKYLREAPFNLSPEIAKRVSLARALLLRPKILLLDSPTHSVGYIGSREIRIILQEYRRRHNITYVVASDDIPFVLSITESLVVMENGTLKFWGMNSLPMEEPLIASLMDEDVFDIKAKMYG